MGQSKTSILSSPWRIPLLTSSPQKLLDHRGYSPGLAFPTGQCLSTCLLHTAGPAPASFLRMFHEGHAGWHPDPRAEQSHLQIWGLPHARTVVSVCFFTAGHTGRGYRARFRYTCVHTHTHTHTHPLFCFQHVFAVSKAFCFKEPPAKIKILLRAKKLWQLIT